MAAEPTRRQFIVVSGALWATGFAGCAGTGRGGGEPTGTSMADATTDGAMTETSMDDAMTEDGMTATEFSVRVENVSTEETPQTMAGAAAVPLARVAFVVYEDPGVLFQTMANASPGLERLAEDGSPTALVDELTAAGHDAGAAAVPAGADEPGPIGPGGAYEFTVSLHDGQRLSIATMFVQSNDLFYAPEPGGIQLFDDGEPVDGNFTDALRLWDAGTEVNEEPGAGPNQAPRQSDPNTGPSEDEYVRRIADVDDGYHYPAVSDVVTLTITPGGMG